MEDNIKMFDLKPSDDFRFKWVSESTACETCQEMNGEIYDTAEEIPDKPHPNCKCHIDLIEKDTGEFISDPLEARRKRAKNRKMYELARLKLLGDTKSLEEEIDGYIKKVDEQDSEIEKFENTIDTSKLDVKYKQKLSDFKEKVDYSSYKLKKAKEEVTLLEIKIVKAREADSISDGLDKLYYELQYAKSYADSLVPLYNEMIKNIKEIKDSIEKNIESIILKNANKENSIVMGDLYSNYHNMQEANNLFKIALNANNNENYVKANGKLYESIDDLQNNNLSKDIRERIRQESAKKDCKVLVLNPDSSVSKKIENSHALSRFLSENMRNLQNNISINNVKIEFQNDDKDLYSSLHGAVVKNAYLDSEENLNLRIEDYYNFNPNRTSLKGQLGEKLQKQGDLEPYYIITVLKIPKEVWQKSRI